MGTMLKSFAVALVCVVTWSSMNLILAQFQRGKPAPPSTSRTQETSQKKVVNAGAVVSAPLSLESEEVVSGAHLDVANLRIVDGTAKFAAKATLRDKLQKNSYVWRLTLLDAESKTIDQILYDHQVFRMEPDGLMEPTFEESFQLTPETRMVQLSLFEFPPGTDMATFLDSEHSLGYLVLRTIERVND